MTLLARTPDFAPWLRVAIPVAAAIAIAGAVALRLGVRTRAVLAVAAVTGAVALAAGPASYSVATVGQSLTSNNVLAGPASAGAGFGGGSGGPGGPSSGFGGPGGTRPSGAGVPTGPPPTGANPSSSQVPADRLRRHAGARLRRRPGGGSVSASLIRYLEANQGSAKYLVAANGSMTTAPIIIQTGKAVVTIGGFNGADPAPTVSRLAKMVAAGELKYVLLSGDGGGFGGPGSGNTSSALSTWVKQHGTAVTGVSSGSGTLYKVGA